MLGLWEQFRDSRSCLCSSLTLDRKLWVEKQLVHFDPHHVNSTHKYHFILQFSTVEERGARTEQRVWKTLSSDGKLHFYLGCPSGSPTGVKEHKPSTLKGGLQAVTWLRQEQVQIPLGSWFSFVFVGLKWKAFLVSLVIQKIQEICCCWFLLEIQQKLPKKFYVY